MTTEPTRDERSMLAELGRRHRLWEADRVPELLARGTENTTFAVGGCVVRRGTDAPALAREVALLGALANATTVPVPVPLMYDPELGVFAYRRLAGTPLLLRQQREWEPIVDALVDVLAALGSLEAERLLPVDDYANGTWHRDAVQGFLAIRPQLSADRAGRVSAFLEEAPPAPRGELAAQHNDLGVEHLLVDHRGRLTGVIDWTDSARADPARDLGSIYRDLGPRAALRVSEGLSRPTTDDELSRIRFHARCRWIEDAVFAFEAPVSREAYLANALRTFDHTFGSEP